MRVLITGIEGFVAPHLARLYTGTADVLGTYYNAPTGLNGISSKYMDITDMDSVRAVISSFRPDLIFHLAGFSSVGESWNKPRETFKINVEGTRNLLDVTDEYKLSPKILVVSSAEIYGVSKNQPIKESNALNPISPYAKSRLEQENAIKDYPHLNIIIARSFTHTGPGQLPNFVCASFANQVAQIEKRLGDSVIRHGNLSPIRDFLDVRDVVMAYKVLLEKGQSHELYNVSSGKGHPIKEILDLLISFSTVDIKAEIDPSRVRPADIPEQIGDNTKICRETGWKPIIQFEDTLRDMLNYWRNRELD